MIAPGNHYYWKIRCALQHARPAVRVANSHEVWAVIFLSQTRPVTFHFPRHCEEQSDVAIRFRQGLRFMGNKKIRGALSGALYFYFAARTSSFFQVSPLG